METTVGQEKEVEHDKVGTNVNEYREAVKKLIETYVRKIIDAAPPGRATDSDGGPAPTPHPRVTRPLNIFA